MSQDDFNAKAADLIRRLRSVPKADVATCLKLIEDGANVHAVDQHGYTPLLVAAAVGFDDFLPIIDALIAKGADVNHASPEGTTVLMSAALGKNEKIVQRLIAAGARADVQDAEGQTALDHAEGERRNDAVIAVLRRLPKP